MRRGDTMDTNIVFLRVPGVHVSSTRADNHQYIEQAAAAAAAAAAHPWAAAAVFTYIRGRYSTPRQQRSSAEAAAAVVVICNIITREKLSTEHHEKVDSIGLLSTESQVLRELDVTQLS
ncbi:hypothetical protein DPMN_178360 [Dreissena polymorpha]|uniref:Uncharacterized protein n=1 Tax=Dreissena polymorpha TaxID=45954 RepID=A0A9D4EBY2_DREPO|nr:hypothetical protein DPMN_178360 [Dreissena polymorpha]